jgi:multiple sugar transport system permease protein
VEAPPLCQASVRTTTHTEGRPRRWRPSQKSRAIAIFVLPYTLFLIAFGVGPGFYAIWISLRKVIPGEGIDSGFVGFTNYATVLGDERFRAALQHIGMFLLYWLPASVLLATVLALLLHASSGPIPDVARMVYFLPGAVVGAASAVLWIFMLDPSVSPIGSLLGRLGYSSLTGVVQVDHLPIIFALMALWTSTGFWIVVLYAALRAVPQDVVEAARIDGCRGLGLAVRIQLPLIRKYILFMLILSFAGGTQLFVEPQVLAYLSNLQAVPTTWSLSQLAYVYAFQQGDFGLSAALAILLLSISVIAAAAIVVRANFFGTIE